METSFSNRLQATLLAILTVGLVLLAVLNFVQEGGSALPWDGVWWTEAAHHAGLIAEKVPPGTPGKLAGLQAGDLLSAVNDVPVRRVSDFERELIRIGPFGDAHYTITRDGIALEAPVLVIPEKQDRSLYQALRIIALIYLSIGIYVLFRRWTAPRATHFYVFCLVSFALYALHYTGVMDGLDATVYWCNVLAEALQPAVFVHFALSFPEERLNRRGQQWLLPLIYLPGAAVVGLRLYAFHFWEATEMLLHKLDQVSTAYDTVFYLLATALFLRSYARAGTPLLRQQLKWLTRGTLLAVLPYTVLSAIPFLLDLRVPAPLHRLAGLSLVFLPLTFCWAIVRYRLMDTDLIFKRGVAYIVASGLILGGYFGVIAGAAGIAHNRLPESARNWGEAIAIVLVAAFFEPLKRRIQSWVDRVFDRHKYDYRKALIEFGRGLSSETDLTALLNSIVERLPGTLLVSRVAVFMTGEDGKLRLAAGHGLPGEVRAAQDWIGGGGLELGFLNFDQDNRHSHIFLENAQQALHLSAGQRHTAAQLDLNYYLPCRVQNGARARTIAVIGLGRTEGGDFLSSEDVELLESLASYIGIALQNASLYTQLELKISEFERLKEFNENIVESINVGILAVDLNGRIESWNAQMEAMYALSRGEVLGQALRQRVPFRFLRRPGQFPQRGRGASPVQVPADHAGGRAADGKCGRGPAVVAGVCARGPHRAGGRHHRAGLAGGATGAGRQAELDRLAGGGGGARNQYAAGGDLELRADAHQTASRRRQAGTGTRKDHLPKLPRRGDCQRAAEFLAHFHHRDEGDRPEPGHPRHAVSAGAPVQDRADPGGAGAGGGSPPHPRKLRQAAAGVPEPDAERQGSHAGRRAPEHCHAGEWTRGGGGERLRFGHCAGAHEAHLRSVLHHQDHASAGRQTRHRPGIERLLRHHPGTCRQDPS